MSNHNDFLLPLNLLDEQDSKKYLRKLYIISNNPEKHYRKFEIKKRGNGKRLILEPKPILKHIQKKILEKLEEREISEYAKAYKKSTSLKQNASSHIGKKMILKLDIKDFFSNISFSDVYNYCFKEYYPKQIAILLTYLCTYYESLPQGAVTSPYISNIVMKDFDETVGTYCKKHSINYTRYSDDMTFSGNFNPSNIISYVRKKLKNKGMEINDEKTHIIKKGQRQIVTGLIVNTKVNTPKEYRKQIRKEIYYIRKYGIKSHLKRINNKDNPREYLKKIYGKINYCLSVNNSLEFKEYKKYIEIILSCPL